MPSSLVDFNPTPRPNCEVKSHHAAPLSARATDILPPIHALKRRREEEEEDDRLSAVFNLWPCPHSHLDTAIKAHPLALLSRASLPLYFLDPRTKSAPLSSVRFFSARIDALEENLGTSATLSAGPKVLIARVQGSESLFAIERVKNGIFTSCKLGDWVDEQQLKQLSLSSSPSSHFDFPEAVGKEDGYGEWWRSIELTRRGLPGRPQPKRSKGENSEVMAQQSPVVETSPALMNQVPRPDTAKPLLKETEEPVGDGEGHQTSHSEMFGNLVSQYLDALYISSASLAYLAKGSLSRARAAFSGSDALPELADFLRSLVLSVSQTEKRYKESIPAALQDFTQTLDSQGAMDGVDKLKPSQKKKRRAVKRSKAGLLPGEDEILQIWWASSESNVHAGESLDSSLRSRLAQVRSRETSIQLMLILETLALDEISHKTAMEGPETQGSQPTEGQHVGGGKVNTNKGKPKKPKDLRAIAEALVDRLTIWQSIEPEDDVSHSRLLTPSSEILPSVVAASNDDRVKEFCLDVIIPFYGARLPELVSRLSEKMGLQSMSLVRPRKTQTNPSSAKPAPGTALSREQLPIVRRTFNRVLSDTSKKHSSRPPSLLRSATDSSLPKTKLERSETPKSPITGEIRSHSRSFSRSNSIVNSKYGEEHGRRPLSRSGSISNSLSSREVDMSAITKFNEAKAKKKVNIERELKDAIAFLKKPNRTAAGNEIVNDVEARFYGAQRLGVLTQRRSHLNILVNATPKRHSKVKHAVTATPQYASASPNFTNAETASLSSTRVPSSITRPFASGLMPRHSQAISATPSKQDPRQSHFGGNQDSPPDFLVPSSTLKSKDGSKHMSVSRSSAPSATISGTPTRPIPTATAGVQVAAAMKTAVSSRSSLANTTAPNHTGQSDLKGAGVEGLAVPWEAKSIYQNLGWDNDDYDELT